MEAKPNRIRELREQRGLTLDQLAALTKHATKPEAETDLSTIQKLEKGRRKLTEEWRRNIAAALGVDPDELLAGERITTRVRWAPRLGKIAAGNWREAIEDATETIATTAGGPNVFALDADGDSMDRIVPPGHTLIIDPDDRELVDGKHYAMLRPGGDATFKTFYSNPPRLEPCSSNPAHKTILLGEEPLTTLGRVVAAQRIFS
jgi:repressor LexA